LSILLYLNFNKTVNIVQKSKLLTVLLVLYLKFVLKVTHPFRKRRFRQISLNSASAVRASEEVQLSLIGSRQYAFHRAIHEPCALPLSPPKSGSE